MLVHGKKEYCKNLRTLTKNTILQLKFQKSLTNYLQSRNGLQDKLLLSPKFPFKKSDAKCASNANKSNNV
jgi:hypothetical protein